MSSLSSYIGAAVAGWVVVDTLREIRWERKHPDEVSPWRIRRLIALIERAGEQGYNGVVVLT